MCCGFVWKLRERRESGVAGNYKLHTTQPRMARHCQAVWITQRALGVMVGGRDEAAVGQRTGATPSVPVLGKGGEPQEQGAFQLCSVRTGKETPEQRHSGVGWRSVQAWNKCRAKPICMTSSLSISMITI